MEKVLVCLDGCELSKAVCDYGMFIAKKLDLPLVLLNVVKHSHLTKKIDLSGNIGLGSRERLLDELSNEEMNESKELIAKGKTILKEMQAYIESQNFPNCTTLQRHGTLYETLDALSYELKIAIVSINGEDREELIRTLNIPILLVNSEFKPIESILMAYDGSEYAIKAINIAKQNPIFPNVKRYIVNVEKDFNFSNKLLDEAKSLFVNVGIEVETESLSGERVDAILKYQEKNNLDIIAMGAYSHNRFKSAIFGSFTTKMLLNAKKPLLLFR
ncbi:MAG TPA: universal stress protein [Sulfurimonas sp. UBA12504]|nr:MAG TPA: universal stress protein [Sulfurimonas sp. UBA12504]